MIYVLAMIAFVLWQRRVVRIETIWTAKPKILIICLFLGKVCQLWMYIICPPYHSSAELVLRCPFYGLKN